MCEFSVWYGLYSSPLLGEYISFLTGAYMVVNIRVTDGGISKKVHRANRVEI